MHGLTRARRPSAACLLAAGIALAACGPSAGPAGSLPRGTLVPAPTPVVAASPAASPAAFPGPPATAPDLAARVGLEVVTGGLDTPVFATGAGDGSGRLFVVEQAGRVRVVRDGRLDPEPFLDITDRVTAGGERGLLGLAFPAGFGTATDRFAVHYSGRDGATTIATFTAAPGGPADPASERLVLVEPQPYGNHNGGWIGFDATGMLLVALGDGGAAGDPEGRAGRLDTLLGKILRIDAFAPGGYGIPADNPFVGRAGARAEILHLGLRNPWRASLDPATGDLWLGDVGQGAWEEVDVARAGTAGLDFGWDRTEGPACHEPAEGCDRAGVTDPVTWYGHDGDCSITGGVVLRGSAVPALRGAYLFADWCSGRIRAIDAAAPGPVEPVLLLDSGRSLASFGTDDAGEVYLVDARAGELLRLVPG